MKRILVAITLVFGGVVLALPPEVQKAIRPTNPLTIREGNRDDIWSLRPGPKQLNPGYVILDVRYEMLQSDMIKVLQEYVRSGHGVLITRLYGCHQMFSDVISLEPCHEMSDPMLFVVDNTQRHPILTSVEKVEFGTYFPIIPTKQDQGSPVLQMEVDRDKNTVGYMASCYKYGNGRILLIAFSIYPAQTFLRPQLLTLYDNHRFVVNVDQWLAGYPIPETTLGTTGTSRSP